MVPEDNLKKNKKDENIVKNETKTTSNDINNEQQNIGTMSVATSNFSQNQNNQTLESSSQTHSKESSSQPESDIKTTDAKPPMDNVPEKTSETIDKPAEPKDPDVILEHNLQNLPEATDKRQYNNYRENTPTRTTTIVLVLIALFAVFVLLGFSIFTILNTTSKTIANGVFIKGVDVSGMSKESALNTINTFISEHSAEEVTLKHGDYECALSLQQISASFDVEKAVDDAYALNKKSNMIQNSLVALKLLFAPQNIEPEFTYDSQELRKTLEDISPNLPDTIVESSYYVDGTNLILTKGHKGQVVDVDKSEQFIVEQIKNLNYKGKTLNLITYEKSPKELDISAIYNEVHKNPRDAYFTQNPYALYPSENGVDFAISIDEAKALMKSDQEEIVIPLKVLYPNVTTDMLGDEAFPNELSQFSTNYVNNANRTTNLIIAANKINGTILMPNETFSFNKVVGERTIADGYKNAAIYVNGQTVDGLAGGICQVSTTLYQAALYANLEIIERRNHQFVPSYIGPGLDATVVYGLTDFQFKNNRNYPIKILASVGGGVCNFRLLGLATADDYEVQINAYSSTTSTSINATTYKTLYKNGEQVSSEIISRDTYKRH